VVGLTADLNLGIQCRATRFFYARLPVSEIIHFLIIFSMGGVNGKPKGLLVLSSSLSTCLRCPPYLTV